MQEELTLGVMGGASRPPHPRAASSQGSPREGRAGWEQVSLSITVSELHRGQEGGASTLQLGSQEDRAAGPGENVEDVRHRRERSCVSFSSSISITRHDRYHHHHHNNITTTTTPKSNFSLLSSDHTSGLFHTRNRHNSISTYLSLLLHFTDEDSEAQRV